MPGGPKEAYERVRPVFEAAAAKVNGDPCVTWLGPGSAGHFVKMVHNGIEYGVMQLLAETYDLMKRGLGLNDDELHDVFSAWNNGELNGYLMEITSHIFSKVDERTGKRLIDEIIDVAKQKGTGMWTSQSAMELQVPIPTMDLAVAMRFTYQDSFAVPSPDAYETLLWDVMNNDPTLFMRSDQVQAAWQLLMPVLETWAKSTPRDFPNYAAGSWGPKAADALLAREGHAWRPIA